MLVIDIVSRDFFCANTIVILCYYQHNLSDSCCCQPFYLLDFQIYLLQTIDCCYLHILNPLHVSTPMSSCHKPCKGIETSINSPITFQDVLTFSSTRNLNNANALSILECLTYSPNCVPILIWNTPPNRLTSDLTGTTTTLSRNNYLGKRDGSQWPLTTAQNTAATTVA